MKQFGKIIISGIFAIIILDCFGLFYYNCPIHDDTYDGNYNRVTETRYEKNFLYTFATEGYGYGRVNNEGYLNSFDYNSSDQIDVLMIGSSQMEALQVGMQDSMSSILNNKLGGNVVYNLGISGSDFITCAGNMQAAVKKYKPNKFVVFETPVLDFESKDVDEFFSEKDIVTTSSKTGLMGIIRQNKIFRTIYRYNPFFKLLFLRIQEFVNKDDVQIQKVFASTEKIDKVLEKMQKNVKEVDAKIIIIYHPEIELDKEGGMILKINKNIKEFETLCKKNGIYLLDMTERFKKEYANNHILPYGFNNTSIGVGHFNRYGHEMIADELYKLIKEVE